MSAPTHTGRASRTQAPPTARPSYVEVAAPKQDTPIPDDYGGILERAVSLTASGTAAASRAYDGAKTKLRDMADNSLGFMNAVGMFCVLYALVRVFTHDMLGLLPEREIVELRSEVKRLSGKLYDTEKELTEARADLLRQLSGDGDSTAEEAR